MRRLWMRLLAMALVAMMTAVGALAEGGEGLEPALADDAVPECDDVLPEAGSPAEVSAPLPGEPDTKPEIMAERGDFEIVDGVLVAYYGSGGDVVIPAGVTVIGENAFISDQGGITSVTIPEGVTSIERSAFDGCFNMTKVDLPSTLVSIGDNAFNYCKKLGTIILPNGLSSIGDDAFKWCYNLTKITLPNSVTHIGESPFYRSGLTSATLSSGLQVIPHSLFNECGQLTTVIIPEGPTAIEGGAFYQCYSLARVDIPASVTSISKEAIEECSADVEIHGKAGSTAEKFAKAAGYTFVGTGGAPKGISIKQGKSATLYMGNTLALTAVLNPTDAVAKLSWSSSDTKVATVNKKGVVTPKKAGKVKITVKTDNRLSATIAVNVVDAKSVSIKQGKKKTMKVGGKLALTAVVSPGKVKGLTWKSSKSSVASVSKDGVVTAKKKGKVKITVTAQNGKSATIEIRVKAK